jgi:hypothetical protein
MKCLNDDGEFDIAGANEGRSEIRAADFIGNGPQGNMNVSDELLAGPCSTATRDWRRMACQLWRAEV